METESKLKVARALGRGRDGEQLSIFSQIWNFKPFGEDENVLKLDGGDGYTTF